MPFLSPVPERREKEKVCSPAAQEPRVTGPTLLFDDNHIRVVCRIRPPNSREAAFENKSAEVARE